MGISKRMVTAEFQYLQHLAKDGRDLYARALQAAYQEAKLAATPAPFASVAAIVTAINGANGGAGIPNVTASASGSDLVLTTNATGTTEAITVVHTGTANAALGFSTTSDTTGTGTSAPAAGSVTGSAITTPVSLAGLTLNYVSTHSSTPTSGTITFSGSGGVILVTGQVVDAFGNPIESLQDVTLETQSVTAANIAAATSPVGTIIAGSGTTKVWMQTSALGAFAVNVTDATEGQLALIKAHVPDGIEAFLELQY
jgi:hypothetical protein